MSRRTLVVLAAVVVAVATVPAVAWIRSSEPRGYTEVGGYRSFTPERREVAYRDVSLSTTETRFRRIEGLEVLAQTKGVVTARFSGEFAGGPVEVMVRRLPRAVLAPGDARFVPAEDGSSFSYEFVDPRHSRDIQCRRYAVSWRSPTGAEVVLHNATFTVDYRFADRGPGGVRSACVD